jgi:HlyD family secretion protein
MTGQQVLDRTEQVQPVAPPRSGARRRVIPVVLLFISIAAALAISRVYFATPPGLDNVVTLSGRIEGDDSAVAPKTSGRILEVRVREGDTVKAGETIAVLDDQQIRSRQEQARVAVLGAEARAKAAGDQIAVLEEQLQQNQLQTEQASVDAEGRVRQAEADLAAADAGLAQQEASYHLAVFDKEAYTRLAQSGAVSERQGKQAVATADQQEAAVNAAKRRVEASRGALTTAQANLSNAGIRGAQTAAVRKQIAQQQSEIAAAMANAELARAQLVEAQANLQDLTVTAPIFR